MYVYVFILHVCHIYNNDAHSMGGLTPGPLFRVYGIPTSFWPKEVPPGQLVYKGGPRRLVIERIKANTIVLSISIL